MNPSDFDIHSSRARATASRTLPLEPTKDTRGFPWIAVVFLAGVGFWVGMAVVAFSLLR